MIETYDGIILARREIGESSCFIEVLTDEKGLIEATAHGIKKINSPLMSSTALFSYSTISFSHSRARYTVNSAKQRFSFHRLGEDIHKLALASYFAQAVRACTPTEQNQLEVSRDSLVRFLAIALFETLNAGVSRTLACVKAAFELRYSSVLGFTPDLVACHNCGHYDCERGMFFLSRKSKLVCADCINPEFEGMRVELLPETLFAMRNIVFSSLERCFKFTVGEDAEKQLAEIAEDYFLYRAERTFTALEYYKKL